MYDLTAVQAEAESRPFEFKLQDDVFTLPTREDCDWRVVEYLDKGDLVGAIKTLLADEYERFVSHRVTVRQLKALLDAWGKFQGVTTEK